MQYVVIYSLNHLTLFFIIINILSIYCTTSSNTICLLLWTFSEIVVCTSLKNLLRSYQTTRINFEKELVAGVAKISKGCDLRSLKYRPIASK